MVNLTSAVTIVKQPSKPVRSRPGRRAITKVEAPFQLESDVDVQCCPLPKADGTGLTQDEAFRLNRAENTARAAYSVDCPDADLTEVFRVGTAARHDALRAVLRDRPAAGDIDSVDAIPGADEAMDAEELAILEELNATNPAGAVEADLSRYPAFDRWPDSTSNWFYAPEPRLTLLELVEAEVARMRRMGTAAGDLMSHALDQLACGIRATDARTPAELEARLQVLEDDFTAPCEYEPELTAGGRCL